MSPDAERGRFHKLNSQMPNSMETRAHCSDLWGGPINQTPSPAQLVSKLENKDKKCQQKHSYPSTI